MTEPTIPDDLRTWAQERARALFDRAAGVPVHLQTSMLADALLEALGRALATRQHRVELVLDLGVIADDRRVTFQPDMQRDPITRAAFPNPSATRQLPTHPDDIAVDRFAVAMKAKLALKREQGRGGWDNRLECTQAMLSTMLREHVDKPDPVDVANFAMMLHERGETILPAVVWQRVNGAQPAPTNTWVHTWREGERGTNICRLNSGPQRDEPEWVDQFGRTTITHHSLAAPTHYAPIVVPRLPG